jgi:uncharacterized protein
MKPALVCATLVLALSVPVGQRAGAGQTAKPPAFAVPDRVPPSATLFSLTDVRLLNGPFRDAMVRDQKFLLEIDPDRLLHMFRVTAGLDSKARPYGGWEAPEVELRGHSLGHYLSACALMYSSTGDERFKARLDRVVAELALVQQSMPSRGFNAGYLSAFPEEFFDRVDGGRRVWAPYYTIHKIMAGLLDAYEQCGNQQALDVLVKKARWVRLRVDRLSDEQQQRALDTEFGGMMEVLANLYARTGDPEVLRTARKFDHRAVFDPLARGEDALNSLHGNTQIPKAIGAARLYELTAERRYQNVAGFFWQHVVGRRSYVIGGNTDGEQFFPPEQFSMHLSADTTETCNTYNMLKLTRHLFQWAPTAQVMDFYERALLNHILASQDPATGGFCYYVPLRPGAFKTYSTPDMSFWCCVGTGMENHAKYTDTIYCHDAQSLGVNLFIASELTWKDKGLTVRQETRFPEEEGTRLTLKCENPMRLAIRIRYPDWANRGMTLSVNRIGTPVTTGPGSYAVVEREWRNGDTIEVRFPMSLHMESMPDDPDTIALLYGPVVLAGDLGKEGMENAKRYGPSAPRFDGLAPVVVPSLVCDRNTLLGRIKPAQTGSLSFRTVGIGRPRDVTLVPFYSVSEPRYTVYWKRYSAGEWERWQLRQTEVAARQKDLERRTIDSVTVGSEDSERTHGFKGEKVTEGTFEGRRWRESTDGWFSYDLKTASGKQLTLVCTYRGSEGRRRAFEVLVDGERVATEELMNHPTEVFEAEYAIPEQLVRGKERINVRFKALPGATAGSIFDVRVIQ